MTTRLLLTNLYILLYPKTSKDFQIMHRLYKHLTMFQFLMPLQYMVDFLGDHIIDLIIGTHKFLLLITVRSHVLIVVNHQYKDVPLDLDNLKAAGELSVFSIEGMSLVRLQLKE